MVNLNSVNGQVEWSEMWGCPFRFAVQTIQICCSDHSDLPFRFTVQTIQICHSDPSVCSSHTGWNISHLYLVKSVQITGKVLRLKTNIVDQTVLSGRCKNLQEKWTKQAHTLICGKLSFPCATNFTHFLRSLVKVLASACRPCNCQNRNSNN